MPASYTHNPLGPYGLALEKTHPLPRQKEQELAARIQEGDLEARNTLIQANLRFVVDMARKYQHSGLALEDLISAGNEGLIIAAERFDGTRGFKFITYAMWWVRQSIQQAITTQSRLIRLPETKNDRIKEIPQVAHRLAQKNQKTPTMDEIANELDCLTEDVTDILVKTSAPLSLTDALNEHGMQLLDTVPDPQQIQPDDAFLTEDTKTQIDRALDALDQRERYIIKLYFGLDGHQPLFLEEIGAIMNITRERVRQLKERALNKLRAAGPQNRLHAMTAN